MEYWTKANFIKCTKCNENITVEPCEDIEVEEEVEETIEVE